MLLVVWGLDCLLGWDLEHLAMIQPPTPPPLPPAQPWYFVAESKIDWFICLTKFILEVWQKSVCLNRATPSYTIPNFGVKMGFSQELGYFWNSILYHFSWILTSDSAWMSLSPCEKGVILPNWRGHICMAWIDSSSMIKSAYYYPRAVPTTHTRQLTIDCSSSFMGSSAHWPPQAPGMHVVHRHICRQTQRNIKLKIKRTIKSKMSVVLR